MEKVYVHSSRASQCLSKIVRTMKIEDCDKIYSSLEVKIVKLTSMRNKNQQNKNLKKSPTPL